MKITKMALPSMGLVITITLLISVITNNFAGLIFAICISTPLLFYCITMDNLENYVTKSRWKK